MKDDSYESDLKIDKFSLEEALLNQAELYAKWTAKWAEAVKNKARAKEDLDVTDSELTQKARKNWEILGFHKFPTDGMVTAWIPDQDEHKEKQLFLTEATYDANILDGVKWAFEHRSRALSDLVRLYLSGYYADEKTVGKDARDLLDEIRKDKHIDQLNESNQRSLLKRRKT